MRPTAPVRAARLLLVPLVASLAACASGPRPLYAWGDYQEQVWHSLQSPDETPQAQLARLDQTRQQALSQNLALPPGFNAHLGLLYLKAGQGAQAQAAFLTEEAQFPESKPYLDFLMKKRMLAKGNGPALVAPTVTPGRPAAAARPAPAASATPAQPAPNGAKP